LFVWRIWSIVEIFIRIDVIIIIRCYALRTTYAKSSEGNWVSEVHPVMVIELEMVVMLLAYHDEM